MRRLPLWWRKFIARFAPRRRLQVIEGDTLPPRLPFRDVLLARDGDDDWVVGLRCPCGCRERLEMMVLPGVAPRWDVSHDARGRVTLHPSVWRRDGCRSHFWLRAGKIVWCD